MLEKEKVLEAIQSLPDEFSIDDLVEKLIILHKRKTGIALLKENNPPAGCLQSGIHPRQYGLPMQLQCGYEKVRKFKIGFYLKSCFSEVSLYHFVTH